MEDTMIDLDLSAIGLVVDDRDPQATFDAGLAKWAELAPTAQPRNGSVEAQILEVTATAGADVIYALNRVISLVVEGILGLYSVTRFEGSPATGVVTVTLDGIRDLTVTAGQRLSDPATGLVLLVTATTSVTAASSIALPVATEEASGTGNAITAGTAVDLLDAVPYAASAEVTTGLSGGADAEDDAAYIDRASTVLARVTSSLVLPVHFEAYLLEDARVGRVTSIDLFEPGGTIGADLGHITLYAYGKGSQLAPAVQAELLAAMTERSASMITVHLQDATIVTQAITLEVHALPGYSTSDVRAGIEAAIAAWMTPATWPWARDIMTTEIIDVAADVPGVDYVTSVAVPSGTVALDLDELAQAGTITVTVTT
jgi:uncharacterized phage protein gp47/JayE